MKAYEVLQAEIEQYTRRIEELEREIERLEEIIRDAQSEQKDA